MSGVAAARERFSTDSLARSTSVTKSLAALSIRLCGFARPSRRIVTASSTAACAVAITALLACDDHWHAGQQNNCCADRAQQHAGEPAASMAADHDKLGRLGLVH